MKNGCKCLSFQIEGYNLTTADDRFVLNPITGRLTTTGVFDRESVPKDTQLVYTLGVEAYDSAPSSLPNTAPRHNTGRALLFTFKMPPIFLQQTTFSKFAGSFGNQKRLNISFESSAGRRFTSKMLSLVSLGN